MFLLDGRVAEICFLNPDLVIREARVLYYRIIACIDTGKLEFNIFRQSRRVQASRRSRRSTVAAHAHAQQTLDLRGLGGA